MAAEVFAKFVDGKGSETLFEHIEHCLRVFSTVQSAFGDVPQYCGNPRFFELLFYAVILHDFGKAASGWQKNPRKWGYRHEILSAAFIDHIDLQKSERQAVALAIYTHHKSLKELNNGYKTFNDWTGQVPVDEYSYLEKLNELSAAWGALECLWTHIPAWSRQFLHRPPALVSSTLRQELLTNAAMHYGLDPEQLRPGMMESRQAELLWLRGMLEICDHLGSGHEDGVRLHSTPFREGFPDSFADTNMQTRAGQIHGSCCIISPTGTGKTEAALIWADANYPDRPGARTLYVLPYTASINAMYARLSDIVGGGREEVALLHGKTYDVLYQTLLDSESVFQAEQTAKRLSRDARELHAAHKLLTPHQILMGIFGLRGFEKRLTELTNAFLIIDEIHAYDPEMMARILFMLQVAVERFRARVCVMSATFPSFLLQMTCDWLHIPPEQVVIARDKDLPAPRHLLQCVEGAWVDHIETVRTWIQAGLRVLVVCNSIVSAIEAFKNFHPFSPEGGSMLLHSRFTVRDRLTHETAIPTVRLLVATQVVEVSLNVSFDALLSEPAPADALVQRFGRVNRRPGASGLTAPCVVLQQEWPKETPVYNSDRRNRTIETLKDLLSITNLPDETRIREWVESVYEHGYSTKEQEKFDSVAHSLAHAFHQLVAGNYSKERSKMFDTLIDAYTVVPCCFKPEHRRLILQKNFRDARQLEVTISKQGYWSIKRYITDEEGIHYADLPYDAVLGLHQPDADLTD